MKKSLPHLLVLFAALLLASCSARDSFTVDGTLADGATMNLRVVYNGPDNVNNVLTAARDGKFGFKGQAPENGTLVEILDNDYRRLAFFYAENGDKLKVTVDPSGKQPQQVEGNDADGRLCEWLAKNARVMNGRDSRAINAAVAAYVRGYSDDIVSTVLMAALYDARTDPAGAAKLLELIAPAARPASMVQPAMLTLPGGTAPAKVLPFNVFSSVSDTVVSFSPRKHARTLLVFSQGVNTRDSIVTALRKFYRSRPKNVGVLDVRFDTDTMQWRMAVRRDSVTWPAAWVAGAVSAPGIDRLAIPTLPYFIVADSTGAQLYRGTSLSRAIKTANP